MLWIAKLLYKDESQRFGRELGSFKALGAPYTVSSLLRDEVERITGERPTTAELRTVKYRRITERVTVCVATDGNQGRGLAYGAREFGCRCVIYIHGHVSPGRKEAIERYGAIVIRIDGEYEASVARAREDARMNSWHFVSSTSWDEFKSPLPRCVMNAYMVMVEEALAQIPDVDQITHVFAQGGVGSIAAAIYLGFQRRCKTLPRLVMVEPVEADCLYQSAAHGTPTPSSGSLRTICAGLACREVSPAVWSILEWLGSDFIRIPDSWVVDAMKALADGGGDLPVVCGESSAGGMAVILKAAADSDLRRALGLDAASQVVLFGLEGATDPAIYERLVGAKHAVFDRQPIIRNVP
ncbi:diaminopropionate ammonia-lyase [Bradyrhizobium diazoefficiens]|uniref:diaminopropionate ammonia-lyase n=1 Tax=Bradyrhizobium diazoefficiens TaxID=1355477 RepID=UPI000A017DF7|nr:diaminopropionate ammonia-lyase [Bradyrhizobium diazoefficiens]